MLRNLLFRSKFSFLHNLESSSDLCLRVTATKVSSFFDNCLGMGIDIFFTLDSLGHSGLDFIKFVKFLLKRSAILFNTFCESLTLKSNLLIHVLHELRDTPLHIAWLKHTFLNISIAIDTIELQIARFILQIMATRQPLAR